MPFLSLTVAAVLVGAGPAADDLRRSARAWEARDRLDLARQSLERLAALRDSGAEDLQLLGELLLRQGDLAGAQGVLRRLEALAPLSREARTLATEVRVASQDRLALASIHRLAQTARGDQVRAALQQVFPDGAPNGATGMEYYELLAAAPDGRKEAQEGLWQLSLQHPGDPRYVVTLARLMARHAPTARTAIMLLQPWRDRPEVRATDVHEILNLAQATLAGSPADTIEEPWPPRGTTPRGARLSTRSPSLSQSAVSSPPTAAEPAAEPVPRPMTETAMSAAESPSVTDPVEEIWRTYREARRLALSGDLSAAQQLMQALADHYPEHADARFARALWAEVQQDLIEARTLALSIEPSQRGQGVQDLLARIQARSLEPASTAEARPAPRDAFAASVQFLHKPGDTGISALSSVTVPFEWRHRLTNGAQWALMAEAVSLDAGHLPTNVKAAESFGTVAVAGLGSSAGIATRTQGLALGVAWRRRDWTLDLGTSPLGFEITRLTGGIRYSPKVGVLDLSVEAFRRPVTSSLLSYAGRTDPASGRRFGGVTDNGVALRLGRYEADASVSLSLRQSSLTGTSVASNTHTSARVAADRTLFHPLGGELTLGTVLTYDSYARNLLAYTFGSAGYFSPQSYSTLTVPVEWVRESAEAAWRVRLTPTLTHRHDASAEQYPTDPAATAALLALGGNPLSSGGSVSAASIGINIDYERRVHGGVIGIGFFHDRADYYRPISLQVYFRPGSVKGARFAALRPIMDY